MTNLRKTAPLGSTQPASSQTGSGPSPRVRRNGLAFWMRWLHIYLSMFGFAALFFFAVTGLTVNHPEWVFGNAESQSQAEGDVDRAWLGDVTQSGQDSVNRLAIVEHLRSAHYVGGVLSDLSVDEYQIVAVFKGPAYSADAFIDRETGRYQLTESRRGFVAVMNDLHKGRDTGRVWSWLIDISAVLMTLISLTGFVLIFYLRRRLISGLAVSIVGLGAVVLLYYFCVP